MLLTMGTWTLTSMMLVGCDASVVIVLVLLVVLLIIARLLDELTSTWNLSWISVRLLMRKIWTGVTC